MFITSSWQQQSHLSSWAFSFLLSSLGLPYVPLGPSSSPPTSCHLRVLGFIEQTVARQDKWFFGVSGVRTSVFSLGSWYRMILPWIHGKNQRASFSVQMEQETIKEQVHSALSLLRAHRQRLCLKSKPTMKSSNNTENINFTPEPKIFNVFNKICFWLLKCYLPPTSYTR